MSLAGNVKDHTLVSTTVTHTHTRTHAHTHTHVTPEWLGVMVTKSSVKSSVKNVHLSRVFKWGIESKWLACLGKWLYNVEFFSHLGSTRTPLGLLKAGGAFPCSKWSTETCQPSENWRRIKWGTIVWITSVMAYLCSYTFNKHANTTKFTHCLFLSHTHTHTQCV